MGVGGLCPKRASAQIRCKCTKKNGASDVSTSFFETLLCTLSLHALFSPHFPGIPPFFFSKTRSRRALLPNLRRALRRRRIRPSTSPPLPGVGNTPTVKMQSSATRITRTSAGFRLLPSHAHRKHLIHNELSVKAFTPNTFTLLHSFDRARRLAASRPGSHRVDKRQR